MFRSIALAALAAGWCVGLPGAARADQPGGLGAMTPGSSRSPQGGMPAPTPPGAQPLQRAISRGLPQHLKGQRQRRGGLSWPGPFADSRLQAYRDQRDRRLGMPQAGYTLGQGQRQLLGRLLNPYVFRPRTGYELGQGQRQLLGQSLLRPGVLQRGLRSSGVR